MAQTIIVASILITSITANLIDFKPSCGICCGKGEFLNPILSLCEECPANQYMDKARHGYFACKTCTVYPQELREIHHVNESLACTRFQDTEILRCDDGFYKEIRPEESRCSFCPMCPNNLSGCCSHEPNVRAFVLPAERANQHLSTEPGSDSSKPNDNSSTPSPTTPATGYPHCNTIRQEGCRRTNSTHEKCFNGVQAVSFKEYRGCQTESSLSTEWIVTMSVLCGISAAVAIIVIIACIKKHKKKKYQPANAYDEL